MKIILSGGTGLIGSAVKKIMEGKCELQTIGRSPSSDFYLDLNNQDTSTNYSFFREASHFVHCAGVTDEDFSKDASGAFLKASIQTSRIVNEAVNAGVQHLVYVSSAHVYGKLEGSISENSIINPISDYALGHYISERIFARAPVKSVLILRPCAVFGHLTDHDQFARWSLIPFAFPKSAITHNSIQIRSSGQQVRNFCGTEDIARELFNDIQLSRTGTRIKNVVGENDLTVLSFANLCASVYSEEFKLPCHVEHGPPDGKIAPLKYTSIYESQQPRQNLKEFLSEMLHELRRTTCLAQN